MNEPWNFSWFVEGKLAAMGYPDREDMDFLASADLLTIVNLTGYSRYYLGSAHQRGITVHDVSIEDFEAPSYEQVLQFLEILDSAHSGVVVHCGKGAGRTGTLLACYLVAREGYTAHQAITETRRRRSHSIESLSQEQAIHKFEQQFNSKSLHN